ncbi:MAG TPA: nuclear transport factor 2 family protein [Candidatus Udaeobacter sp.]|jgi:ketosteroid isomerase-like protein|nr:nuclear transport factor 2 family protein [Candidatus Udaeobacter sp.]
MKRSIPHLAIAIVLLASAFGQSANQQNSENSSSEKEVREAIEKYKTALLRRDVAALEKIWADDYVFVNASGDVLTKEQRLANVKSGATALDSINEDENLTVRVYQNSAVTTSRVTIKGQYNGQPVSGQYRSTLVWVKGSAGWQLVSNQLTALLPK